MIERRRFNRISSNAKVLVTLCDNCKNNLPAYSPIMGRITDFSLYGACLLLDETLYERRHIFYTTQAQGKHIISLEYPRDEQNNSSVIYGNFAWYARHESGCANFNVGIEFLPDQDENILQEFIAKLANHELGTIR